MGALREIGLILVAVSVVAGITFLVHPRAPALYQQSERVENEATVEEVRQMGSAVVWIDARSEQDFEKGHVEGALLLNQEQWAELLWKHKDVIEGIEGTPVVVYCDGERCRRSSEVAERLRAEMGLDPVFVLKGDWRALE